MKNKKFNDIIREREEFKNISKYLFANDFVSIDIYKYLFDYKRYNVLSNNILKDNDFRLAFSYLDYYKLYEEDYKKSDSIMYKYIKIKPIYFYDMFDDIIIYVFAEVIMRDDEKQMTKEILFKEFNNIDHYCYPSSIVLRYNKPKGDI